MLPPPESERVLLLPAPKRITFNPSETRLNTAEAIAFILDLCKRQHGRVIKADIFLRRGPDFEK